MIRASTSTAVQLAGVDSSNQSAVSPSGMQALSRYGGDTHASAGIGRAVAEVSSPGCSVSASHATGIARDARTQVSVRPSQASSGGPDSSAALATYARISLFFYERSPGVFTSMSL